MIRGIHHTALSTPDLERSLRFYCDLLGFEPVLDYRWPVGTRSMDATHELEDTSGRVVLLKAGNAMLELFEFDSPQPASPDPGRRLCDHGITHFSLDVVDIEAEAARLSAAGLRFHAPVQDHGTTRVTYFRDPDGNVIELQETTSPDDPIALEGLSIPKR